MQSITFYNYTSDEHGSEGACIIFIQSLIKSQKQPLIFTVSLNQILDRQFLGNLVSLIMRFLWSIDHILVL